MPARTEEERQDMEDTLHVGATRPAMLLGLPVLLAVALLLLGYLVWINVTGWRGLIWAAALVAPSWILARISIANDLYGIGVMAGWLRTTFVTLLMDRAWRGASTRSPLPSRAPAGTRGMHHAG
jgi:type IV secretory pathway VirB3-like protein